MADTSPDHLEVGPAAIPERLCGRCRCLFKGDPNLYFQTDWALCPNCETILLPGR